MSLLYTPTRGWKIWSNYINIAKDFIASEHNNNNSNNSNIRNKKFSSSKLFSDGKKK